MLQTKPSLVSSKTEYPLSNWNCNTFLLLQAAFFFLGERRAMQILEQKRQAGVYDMSGSIFERQVRFATPIVMEDACVSCYNASSDSPKRDWKTGNVGGIEEFTVSLPLAANLSTHCAAALSRALIFSARPRGARGVICSCAAVEWRSQRTDRRDASYLNESAMRFRNAVTLPFVAHQLR